MTDAETNAAAAELLGWHGQGATEFFEEDFDPLTRWDHAGLLVEKMRGMPRAIQLAFGGSLMRTFLDEAGQHNPFIVLWLTPKAVTVAAVAAVQKEEE